MLAMNRNKVVYALFCILGVVVMFSACRDKESTGLEYARNMYDPIGYNPDQPNNAFANGQTAQTPPKNTAPVGFVEEDVYPNSKEGYEEAGVKLVNTLALNEQNLLQGKKLFHAFCSPCHGDTGDGQGHLVKIEKISGVPSFHAADAASSRGGLMKDMSAGKIYHTIKYGVNMMGSYASQLTPEERWKVVLYVQQLQKAQ
jgi:mono/diheme cytochrome c family protein